MKNVEIESLIIHHESIVFRFTMSQVNNRIFMKLHHGDGLNSKSLPKPKHAQNVHVLEKQLRNKNSVSYIVIQS